MNTAAWHDFTTRIGLILTDTPDCTPLQAVTGRLVELCRDCGHARCRLPTCPVCGSERTEYDRLVRAAVRAQITKSK